MQKHTVYFDGQCPLCNKEISLWRKLSSDQFRFFDVHQALLDKETKNNMLRMLHVRSADGALLIGLRANFKLWRSHPIGWPSYLLSLPGLFHLTEFIYNAWAERRYKKRYECSKCQS